VAFVVMYAVFAYVDIAWDVQNCFLLGIAFAAIGTWTKLGGKKAPAAEVPVAQKVPADVG
jgi:hypothetical protein